MHNQISTPQPNFGGLRVKPITITFNLQLNLNLLLKQQMEFQSNIIVMDAGTGYVKIGFAGQLNPVVHEPCVIARKIHFNKDTLSNKAIHKTLYCQEAIEWSLSDPQVEIKYLAADSISIINSPIDYFPIWSHAIDKMKIDASQYYLLMGTSSTGHDNTTLKKMQWALEIKKFKAFALVHNSFGALEMYKKEMGLVIDIGESASRIFAVSNLSGVHDYKISSSLSGFTATLFLKQMLRCHHHPSHNFKIPHIEQIKTSACKTRLKDMNDDSYIAHPIEIEYFTTEGPKKSILNFTKEAYMVPEIFFNPDLFSYYMPGLSLSLTPQPLVTMVSDLISNCSIDSRLKLLSNIIIVGGTCNFDSFIDRFSQQLEASLKSPFNKIFKIVNYDQYYLKNYDTQIFSGLSMKALLINPSAWTSREEFMESNKFFIADYVLDKSISPFIFKV